MARKIKKLHRVNPNQVTKKDQELHDLWMKTEPYLGRNRIKPIQKIDPEFYNFLVKNNFDDTWDCYSICKEYFNSKYYLPKIKYKIVPHAGVFGLKLESKDRLIAIRNTKKEITQILNFLNR